MLEEKEDKKMEKKIQGAVISPKTIEFLGRSSDLPFAIRFAPLPCSSENEEGREREKQSPVSGFDNKFWIGLKRWLNSVRNVTAIY